MYRLSNVINAALFCQFTLICLKHHPVSESCEECGFLTFSNSELHESTDLFSCDFDTENITELEAHYVKSMHNIEIKNKSLLIPVDNVRVRSLSVTSLNMKQMNQEL